jgi:hypothetical protein
MSALPPKAAAVVADQRVCFGPLFGRNCHALKAYQWVPVSAFALTPIDSAAFAYQLADLKRLDRLAVRL